MNQHAFAPPLSCSTYSIGLHVGTLSCSTYSFGLHGGTTRSLLSPLASWAILGLLGFVVSPTHRRGPLARAPEKIDVLRSLVNVLTAAAHGCS